jgi:hypothetical protein
MTERSHTSTNLLAALSSPTFLSGWYFNERLLKSNNPKSTTHVQLLSTKVIQPLCFYRFIVVVRDRVLCLLFV